MPPPVTRLARSVGIYSPRECGCTRGAPPQSSRAAFGHLEKLSSFGHLEKLSSFGHLGKRSSPCQYPHLVATQRNRSVNILSPLLRLVPAMGIFSPPFCDWIKREFASPESAPSQPNDESCSVYEDWDTDIYGARYELVGELNSPVTRWVNKTEIITSEGACAYSLHGEPRGWHC
eukprot:3621210-Pyramimonas_sp.AAC.1